MNAAALSQSLPVNANAEKSAGGSTVRILDPLAVGNWDALVATLPGHTFFHSAAWARVLEASYGFKPFYFARGTGEKLDALLPFMEVKSWLTGCRGVSLPFSDECPGLGKIDADLISAVTDFGVKRGWKYWERRGGEIAESEVTGSFFGHVINLTGGENQVFESFESSVKRAIRKGEKGNLEVEQSRRFEDMHAFYALHCLTRKKHGVGSPGTELEFAL